MFCQCFANVLQMWNKVFNFANQYQLGLVNFLKKQVWCINNLLVNNWLQLAANVYQSTIDNFFNGYNHPSMHPKEFNDLSDCNWPRTHNHLVHKRTRYHLAKLTKWLSCVVSNYPYSAFDCMFLPRHLRVSEWIHIL